MDGGAADEDEHDHGADPEPFAVAGGDLAAVRVDDQGRDQDEDGDDEAEQGAFGDPLRLDLLAQA